MWREVGCFKNQQRTTISSHSMLLRFHRYQYQSGSIMIFHETSLQFLERQTFDFTLRGFPYIKPWFALRSLWSTSLNIIVPTNMPSAFWMVVKKPLQRRNLDTSHSPSWNWKNLLKKSIFQTDIMQLHGRTFPTSDLKATWDWFGSIFFEMSRSSPNFHGFSSDMTYQLKTILSFHARFFEQTKIVLQLSNMMRTKAGSSLALRSVKRKVRTVRKSWKWAEKLLLTCNYLSYLFKLCTKNEFTKGHVSKRSEMKL